MASYGSERRAVARALRELRTVTPLDIEARGGLSVAETAELMRAFGLPTPAPDEPCLSEEEASVLCEMAALREVWPREVYIQLARVYGQALAHVAQTEVQLFRLHVEDGASPETLTGALERLLPLADPMLTGVHRRWLEHELEQADIRDAEMHSRGGRLPGAVDVSLLFCDLKDFTAYADAKGDGAAVAAIARFADVVDEERGDDGHIVKALGDGYMLAYPNARAAVAAGVRLIDRIAAEGGPRLHASAHSGEAVFRDGDYFGRSVNLAARLLAVAGADELLASDAVVEATEDEFRWRRKGLQPIRGFSEPVEVWRLAGPQRAR